MSGSQLLCEDCFYKYRTDPTVPCGHSDARSLHVEWKEREGRYETTVESIRPIPRTLSDQVTNIVMCDPKRCSKGKCTYAHGRAEQKAWNEILRARGQGK